MIIIYFSQFATETKRNPIAKMQKNSCLCVCKYFNLNLWISPSVWPTFCLTKAKHVNCRVMSTNCGFVFKYGQSLIRNHRCLSQPSSSSSHKPQRIPGMCKQSLNYISSRYYPLFFVFTRRILEFPKTTTTVSKTSCRPVSPAY